MFACQNHIYRCGRRKPLCLFLLMLFLPLAAGPRAVDGWEWLVVDPVSSGPAGCGRALCYRPARERGDLVVLLHGWRQRAGAWRDGTPVARLAERYGVILVAPEMGTCNYMDRYYPETHRVMRWFALPGAVWMEKTLFPWIRARFAPRRIFVAGVSTGARGAVVSGQRIPGIAGVGYLSGDWDIIKDDGNLYRLSLGPLERFRPRWEANDTSRRAGALKGVRVFLAHSTNDRVTPHWQTELMKRDLDRLGVANQCLIDTTGGHDWPYWGSRLEAMFRFWGLR